MGHTCVNIHIHGETPRDSMLSIKSFTAWAPCADHVTSSLSNELNSRNTQLHIRSNKRLQLINSPLSLFTTINTPPTLYSMKSHNSLLLLLQPITELTLSWNKKTLIVLLLWTMLVKLKHVYSCVMDHDFYLYPVHHFGSKNVFVL